jgi:hypothetical protein
MPINNELSQQVCNRRMGSNGIISQILKQAHTTLDTAKYKNALTHAINNCNLLFVIFIIHSPVFHLFTDAG